MCASAVVRLHRKGEDRDAILRWFFLRGRSGVRKVGKVKWFSDVKGYGFITLEDGSDVFVHFSAIHGEGYRTLVDGQPVEFEVQDGPKGLQASNVVKAI